MNNGDWLKLNRSILKWEWYHDLNVRTLFIHCLLRANYDAQKFEGKVIPRGSFVTSREHLSEEIGLSVQQTRTALSKLKSTNEITIKSTNHYSIITVNNWDKWQANQPAEQQPDNQPITTIKEIKKERILINKNIPTKNQILEHLNLIGKTIDVDEFINYWNASDWLDKSGLPINWKQYLAWWKPKQSKSLKVVDAKKQKEEQEYIERMNKLAERFLK